MLNIKRFVFNPVQENTYVVSDETKDCVIIDCGAYCEDERLAIVNYINENRLVPKHLLCTHGHFDHCMGAGTIYKEFGLLLEVNKKDDYLITDMKEQVRSFLGADFENDETMQLTYIGENDTIEFGTHRLKVLSTPGHTPGGVIYHCPEERVVFTGDTLFKMSIGRTDFEGGNEMVMFQTLRNVIAKLPVDTEVWSGHGPKTTIGEEVRTNPFLR